MRPDIEVLIAIAVERAKKKHAVLGPDPYVVLGEEYGEACRAYLEGDQHHEVYELLDVVAVCVRRLEALI